MAAAHMAQAMVACTAAEAMAMATAAHMAMDMAATAAAMEAWVAAVMGWVGMGAMAATDMASV